MQNSAREIASNLKARMACWFGKGKKAPASPADEAQKKNDGWIESKIDTAPKKDAPPPPRHRPSHGLGLAAMMRRVGGTHVAPPATPRDRYGRPLDDIKARMRQVGPFPRPKVTLQP